MANRKNDRLAVKEKGWWPEDWVPVACDGGPLDGHTVPYDPEDRTSRVTTMPGVGEYRVTDSWTGDVWAWYPL